MPVKLFAMMGLTLILLFSFLFGLLAAVTYYFDFPVWSSVIFALLLVLFQWAIAPNLIRISINMRLVGKSEYPEIYEVVERICKKHKVPFPKIAIANIGIPNAFVFGRTPSTATLVLTRGLLNNLQKDEIEGVIGHELGHIKNKDMVIMTIASAIPIIAYFVARDLMFRGRRGFAVLFGVGAFAIYFITNLLVLALSRLREYYADRFGGISTRPRALASALAKITYGLGINREAANESLRAFFIIDPITSTFEISHFSKEYSDLHISEEEVKKAMEWEKSNVFIRIMEIWRTHPLTFKRIRALLELEKGSK